MFYYLRLVDFNWLGFSLFILSFIFLLDHLKAQEKEDNEEEVYIDEIEIIEEHLGKGHKNTFQKIPLHKGENQNANKISEIVEKQQGTRVNRLGAPGTYSTLSIRGANSNQTGFYIDGISIHNPLGSSTNLENLPLGIFETAEIYKSYTPLHLSGTHIGGAIDLIPRKLKKDKSLYFLENSVTSLKGASLGVGLQLPWTIQYLRHEQSANSYSFYNDNGTPVGNTQDDHIDKRKNEDYKLSGYTGLFYFPYKNHKFTILLDAFQKERGLPGVVNLPLEKVRFQEERVLASLKHKVPLARVGIFNHSFSFHNSYFQTKDPKKELSYGLVSQKYETQHREYKLFPYFYFWKDRLALRTLAYQSQSQLRRDKQELAKREEQNLGLALVYKITSAWELLLQRKNISIKDKLGPALDNTKLFSKRGPDKDYSLYSQALRFAYLLHKNIELSYLWNQERRAPSLTEAYGNGNYVLGNPELKSENSYTQNYAIDTKFSWEETSLQWHLAYFRTYALDNIVFVSNSLQTIRAENLQATDTQGWETKLSFQKENVFLSSLSYTKLKATDDGDVPYYQGRYIPFRPKQKVDFYLEYLGYAVRPFLHLHWLGQLYKDRLNSEVRSVQERSRIDCGINYNFDKRVSIENGKKKIHYDSRLSFLIKNLNNEYHSDILGYPLPDRTYEIQFYKEFHFQKEGKK